MDEEKIRAREKADMTDKLKKTMYALIAVAVVLAGVLVYVWVERTSLVNDLNIEKEELTAQMINLQNDYAELSSDYDNINSQLDSSREEVTQLIEKIKKTNATNRSRIRQYEKELGTLRSIMKGYIVQIDSLNTLNKRLTADAAAARKEAAEHKRKAESMQEAVDSLSSQVATGSIVKGRGLILEAYNKSGKVTDRSSRTIRLMASLSLVENDLAEKTRMKVYIRVLDPDGILLTNSKHCNFTYGEETLIASASREVDYTGSEVEMSIYLNDIPSYTKGVYRVEAYTDQAKLGTAELMLR